MNVCFDIDGTITAEPRFFSLLSHAVRKAGGNVYIVTSRLRTIETLKATRQELKELGIVYAYFVYSSRSKRGRTNLPIQQSRLVREIYFSENRLLQGESRRHLL